MVKRLNVSVRYGSHIPALLMALFKTRGAVLELGGGVYSTHTLHHYCALYERPLTTIDNAPEWDAWNRQYETPGHRIVLTPSWDRAPIEQAWDVALVDHSPDERRAIEIERLAPHAQYIIAHDANPRYWRQYGYWRVVPKFRYHTVYDKAEPHTLVLSNFVNLADFWRLP